MNCQRRHSRWQSKRLYQEGTPRQRPGSWGSPGGLLCHVTHRLGLYVDGISFQIIFRWSLRLRVLSGGARIGQPRWMSTRRLLGGGRICGVSFWPFPDSSSGEKHKTKNRITHQTVLILRVLLPSTIKIKEKNITYYCTQELDFRVKRLSYLVMYIVA